jgi:peptidyl-tRNA hydrolase
MNEVREDRVKMYCIFAKESLVKMNGIRGKLGAQAGHAYLHAWWDAMYRPGMDAIKDAHIPAQAIAYQNSERAYKICLVVDTVDQLKEIEAEYKNICGTSLVTDAGFTVFDEPTTTCLGLGPLRDSLKTETLSKLKTLT